MFNIVICFEKGNPGPVLEYFGNRSVKLISRESSEDFLTAFMQWDMQSSKASKPAIMLAVSRFGDARLFSMSEIRYIEALGRLMYIDAESGRFGYYGRLYSAEEKLKRFGFIRVHHSYLVSLRHIMSFNSNRIVLKNGYEISIGRKYLASFREAAGRMNILSLMSKDDK